MNSAVVAETFSNDKKSEYIRFAEKLGADVCFTSDKWICDTLRRSPAEKLEYTHYISTGYPPCIRTPSNILQLSALCRTNR